MRESLGRPGCFSYFNYFRVLRYFENFYQATSYSLLSGRRLGHSRWETASMASS